MLPGAKRHKGQTNGFLSEGIGAFLSLELKGFMKPKLDPSLLSTVSETGTRLWLYPEKVNGFWKKRRQLVFSILFIVLLAAPWLKWKGHPLFLFNLLEGRFHFFGIVLFAHDVPLLLYLALALVFLIAIVTAIWGRVWCGWSCPQTVFTEGFIRPIERLFEGDALARRKLDQAPWTLSKMSKKLGKWISFFGLCLLISHSLLAAFIGTEKVGALLREGPSNHWGAFLLMMGFTGVLLFDLGWFREQFCTIVCPYGRLQSVLVDEGSLTVQYQSVRGEPRGKSSTPGDTCVDCGKCVAVCPTGIDIRNGLQLECIQCTACIDACDLVMERLSRPKGLIGYSSLFSKKSNSGDWKRWARPMFYSAALMLVMGLLSYRLVTRRWVQETWLRSKGEPYTWASEKRDRVLNHYDLELHNQTLNDLEVKVEVNADVNTEVNTEVNDQRTVPAVENRDSSIIVKSLGGEILVHAGRSVRVPLFFEFNASLTHGDLVSGGKKKIPVRLLAHAIGLSDTSGSAQETMSEVMLIGPLR